MYVVRLGRVASHTGGEGGQETGGAYPGVFGGARSAVSSHMLSPTRSRRLFIYLKQTQWNPTMRQQQLEPIGHFVKGLHGSKDFVLMVFGAILIIGLG